MRLIHTADGEGGCNALVAALHGAGVLGVEGAALLVSRTATLTSPVSPNRRTRRRLTAPQAIDWRAVHRRNFLPGKQPTERRRTSGDDIADHRPHLLRAKHGENPEEQHGEDEVGQRAGADDGDTLEHRLAVEKANAS